MKSYHLLFLTAIFFAEISCNREAAIKRQLMSRPTTTIIEGAYAAGKSGDRKYVPLLLRDLATPSVSTSLKFKGFSVYTEKMFALERILHVKPPKPYKDILILPDSVNIRFMYSVWKAEIKH